MRNWALFLTMASTALAVAGPGDPSLPEELHHKGWIAFSAQTAQGDWDLFLMRPDGSERRPLTDTRAFNEAGARFSPDGKRLLFYRMAASEPVDNNTYGTFDLVIADANGKNVSNYGRSYPWADWDAGGRQLAYLLPTGIQLMELTTRQLVRTVPRRGIVQQLACAPDGRAFTGTANGLGPFWNIARLKGDGTAVVAVSETDRYNCTPDWFPDSRHILYARGIIPKEDGRAQLWLASDDGQKKQLLYAEEGRHIYGACASPDGKYLVFTRSVEDLGAVGKSQTTLAIIRYADTPMIGDNSAPLRKAHPDARTARRLDLGPGWEPHWTYSETPALP